MSDQFFSSAFVCEDTLSLWDVELDPSLLENFFFVNCYDAFSKFKDLMNTFTGQARTLQ